jgi:regulator of RNase E activity RraA
MSEDTNGMLARAGIAAIANALLRRGLHNVCLAGLSPVSVEQRVMVGPAYTLRFIPSREDIDSMATYSRPDNLHRRAMEECPPGAVLVVDARGEMRVSSGGDMMAMRLHARGAAGFVTDGGFRDATGIRQTGLPAFHRAPATPATSIALHPAELNGPIGCAGVAIFPGDIIVGDPNGVVAIPAHMAAEVAREAYEAAQYEVFAEMHLSRGRSLFGLFPSTLESMAEYRAWVDAGRPKL